MADFFLLGEKKVNGSKPLAGPAQAVLVRDISQRWGG
jgi:hypothetical protein